MRLDRGAIPFSCARLARLTAASDPGAQFWEGTSRGR